MYSVNPYQKSIVERQLEYNNTLEQFKNAIIDLMEHYDVRDNVFGLTKSSLGKYTPVEINSGYFVIEHETTDIHSAIKEMRSLDTCIRVLNNTTFQVGSVHRYLTECNAGKLYDIEGGIEIER